VNSAAYGVRRRIGALRDGIIILGFEAVRRLALELSVRSTIGHSRPGAAFNPLLYWRHAIAVASITRELARESATVDPETAYAAGLLHDIGKPLLESYGRISYSAFLDYLGPHPTLLIEQERRFIGLGHDTIGALYAAEINLPEQLIQAIRQHHQTSPENIGTSAAPLIALLSLADFIAWSHGYGSVAQNHPALLHPYVEQTLDLDSLDLEKLVRHMDHEVENAARLYHFTLPQPIKLRESLLRYNLTLGCLNSRLHHPEPRQETLLIPHHSLEQTAIISDTLHALRNDLGVERASLLLLDPRGRTLHLTACRNGVSDTPPHPDPIPLGPESGALLACLREKRKQRLSGQTPGERTLMQILGTKQISLIPVPGQHRMIGLLELDNGNSGRAIEDDTLGAAERIAQELGLGLEHAQLLEYSRQRASIDPLTELPNRSSLDTELKQRIAEARHGTRPLALAMLDIDRFKRFNDNFGHPAGDNVLKLIARTLQQTTRETNSVARYGGEEFTAILPGTTREQAIEYCQRLRRAIAKIGRLLTPRFPGEPLTISIGIALLHPTDTPATLLARADHALYRAKQRGRDRIELDDQ
ncbi:MAG: hypothetical protein B0D84_03225, partial [Candidatus Sedimenticola endophacoides]